MRSAVGLPSDWRSSERATTLQVPSASRRSSARSMSVGGPPAGEVHESANVIGSPAPRVKVQLSPFGQSRSWSRSASSHGPLQWSCA